MFHCSYRDLHMVLYKDKPGLNNFEVFKLYSWRVKAGSKMIHPLVLTTQGIAQLKQNSVGSR